MTKENQTQLPGHSSWLIDGNNRKLDYLRVSITDRCNLNCTYCLPFAHSPKQTHTEILRYEEILRLIRIFNGMGVSKVRVTGGEPLVRKGALPFIRRIREMEGIRDLSLTTNGLLLKNNLAGLKAAGVKRLNISLDSLSPENYAKITGRDSFQTVWQGIVQAGRMGFSPLKINMVVLRGMNDHEIEDMARLSIQYPFHIRFIEYMPIGDNPMVSTQPLYTAEIQERIASLGRLQPIRRGQNDGPARRFRLAGARGEIGFISPMSRHFCGSCNRLRLTASGFLRTCLLSDVQTDLKTPLRTSTTDAQLIHVIRQAIQHKPKGHVLSNAKPGRVNSPMSAIGG